LTLLIDSNSDALMVGTMKKFDHNFVFFKSFKIQGKGQFVYVENIFVPLGLCVCGIAHSIKLYVTASHIIEESLTFHYDLYKSFHTLVILQ
jgi:hypothetical protein